MRKKVSKILALIVALVMMLGCAACSNNDTPAEAGGAPAGALPASRFNHPPSRPMAGTAEPYFASGKTRGGCKKAPK